MFRTALPFDPLLIVLEIAALQIVFYAVFFMVVLVIDQISGVPFADEQVFNWQVMRFATSIGCASIIGQVFAAVVAGLAYVLLEGRARKALDFMITTFAIHLLVVCALSSLPTSWSWWISFIASCIAGIFTAQTVSMKAEMQPIVLDQGRLSPL